MRKLNERKINEGEFDSWKKIDASLDSDTRKLVMKISSDANSDLGYDVVAIASLVLELLEDSNTHGVGGKIADILYKKFKADGFLE